MLSTKKEFYKLQIKWEYLDPERLNAIREIFGLCSFESHRQNSPTLADFKLSNSKSNRALDNTFGDLLEIFGSEKKI